MWPMDLQWLVFQVINTLAIDTGIEPDYENRLIASAKAYGWNVIYPRRIPFTDELLDVTAEDIANPHVWFHGDIATAKSVAKTTSWQVHAPWDQLRLTYLSDIASDLMVNDHSIDRLDNFYDKAMSWFDVLGEDDCIFVKSVAADKTISGRVFHRPDFETQWAQATFYDPPPDTILAISRPRKIDAEARFIVVGGRVITGSYYKTGGQTVRLQADNLLTQKAINIRWELEGRGYDPAPSWVLDLALVDGQWLIMEVGATSCCGLYECDTDQLVKALTST